MIIKHGTKFKKQLEANIWKFAVMLMANKRIFVAILGAYYLTIPDVTPKTIGAILLVGNVAGFLLEIPSGYVSDKMGHKKALVFARVLMFISTLFFLFASSVPFLILGSIFMSASWAFNSGTGSAFMHENLTALGRDAEYTKVMGKISSIGFAVPVVFTVLVPFLVSVSYQAPFVISLVIDLVGLLAVASMVSPPVTPQHIDEIGVTNFKAVMKEGYRLNYFSIAIFSGIIGGVLSAVGAFRAPYQVFLEVPVIWFGVFFGVGRIAASVLLAYSGKIKDLFTRTSFYRFQVIYYSILLLVLGLVSTWQAVVAIMIFINALQWGLSKVDQGYQLEVIKNSKFKATLLSVRSQVNSLVVAVIAFGLGLVIEQISYRLGFLYLALMFIAIIVPLYFYIASRAKEGMYSGKI